MARCTEFVDFYYCTGTAKSARCGSLSFTDRSKVVNDDTVTV